MSVLISALLVVTGFAQAASTAIKVDQVGYPSDSSKVAMVVPDSVSKLVSGLFLLRRDGDKEAVYKGSLTGPVRDTDSGDSVYKADFSEVKSPGKYFLDIPGIGRSWTFAIGPNVYRRTYYLAARSYYGQRCGTAVDLGSEFPAFKHAACHLEGAYNKSSGRTGARQSSHGWHDAGDYGRYVVNSGISTGTLLWTAELFSKETSHISLRLPESGNGTPDLLDEARWNLEWMLTMQDRDGGVWHKQTSTRFSGFVMPEADTLVSEVTGSGAAPFKTSCATGDFAAVMAIAGRAYKPFDGAFAARAEGAAEGAWSWLDKNPNIFFRNPEGVSTGEYGDTDCRDERLWAAAELWRTTIKPEYANYFLKNYQELLPSIRADRPPSWNQVAPLALWSYALTDGGEKNAGDSIRSQSIAAADEIAIRALKSAYGTTMQTSDYIWGSNAVAANYALQLIIAHQFAPMPAYIDAAMSNLHYLLGRNAFSLSWVTQVGENAFKQPHHRPSAADNIDLPWPGLLSGGPNQGRQDPVSKRMLSADLPPAKCYLDETGAYAVNEVAINWNAPLVFVLASLQVQ